MPLWGRLAISGDLLGTPTGVGVNYYPVKWLEARDNAKHPPMYRTAPHCKELSSPNVRGAKQRSPALEESCTHPEGEMNFLGS